MRSSSRYGSSLLGSSLCFGWNALAKASPFDLGSPCVCVVKRPPGELVYARATDLSRLIKNVYNALYAVKGKEGTLLTMSARNEEKDTLIASGNFRGHTKIKIQSVASSAGGTAMMAIVAQPYRGHLNGNVNDEFDMEECYARATVAGTRAQSLTVIVSPLDMQGMIGMMQVLAGRAHTIHEVYRGNDNWQLPQLEEPQVEQSNAEVQSWRISHAGTWAEQNFPPLAIGFNLRRNVDGQERVVFLRLRLVLVKASKIPSARTHISQLEHIVQKAYDTRHKLTLPDQRTDELMIWGYAIDKQHRVMAWLGPACSSQEPFAPMIRHWRSGTITHTVPLPGIHFFDARRIRPQLTPDSKLGEKLPSLGTNELIPEEPANEDYGQGDRADIQHRREQERDVRGATKTIAQLALEMSHVHRLADLIKEKADLLKELAMRRKSYQDEVKESAKGKSTAASSAPKKNSEPPGRLPPLLPQCPPLMAVRLWMWMPVEVPRNPLLLPSLGPLRKVRAQVALLLPQRNMTHPQCRLQQLNQTSNKMIRPPCLLRREFRLELLQSHGHFAMKFSLSYPTFRKNGRSSKST